MPTGVERRPRSHRMKFCVQRGLGALPRASKRRGKSRRDFLPCGPVCINTGIACRFLVPCIFALSGGISSNEKKGRLHILLLIIRIFQFDGSVNDTLHNGQILLRAQLQFVAFLLALLTGLPKQLRAEVAFCG